MIAIEPARWCPPAVDCRLSRGGFRPPCVRESHFVPSSCGRRRQPCGGHGRYPVTDEGHVLSTPVVAAVALALTLRIMSDWSSPRAQAHALAASAALWITRAHQTLLKARGGFTIHARSIVAAGPTA